MSGPSAGGLPQFIRYLGTFPAPRDALEALHQGPLREHGARANLLWQVRGDDLVALASVGHTRAEFERYAVLPLSLDLRVCRAVRTGRLLVDAPVSANPAAERHMRDGEIRAAILARSDAHTVMRVPLLHGGAAVGALGLVLDRPWPGDEYSDALVECVSLAMGLWLTHPRTGLLGAASRTPVRDWSLAFTERQREILRLVEQGWSNAAIAAALNVSASSVKQDLQRAMRALRSDDRATAAARARTLELL